MSNVLRLAIVDPDDSKRSSLKSLLLGMEIVWLEAECSRYEFFSDVIGQTNPDIGVVSLDGNPEKAISLIEEVHTQTPDCSILCVSSSTDGQLILQAMRAGAKEFLTHPLKVQDLAAALDRINRMKVGAKGGKTRNSNVIAICGSTGGVGSTSLGVNLGCMLGQDPANSVVLVDLDLSLGDADVFLDAIPERVRKGGIRASHVCLCALRGRVGLRAT
jgi:pilus assembly protein CpaE